MTGLSVHALQLAVILADTGDSGDSGEGNKAGPIGLAVILLLIIACAFLFKSMSRHLRKVREEFSAGDGLTVNTAAGMIGVPPPSAEPAAAEAEAPPGRDPDQ